MKSARFYITQNIFWGFFFSLDCLFNLRKRDIRFNKIFTFSNSIKTWIILGIIFYVFLGSCWDFYFTQSGSVAPWKFYLSQECPGLLFTASQLPHEHSIRRIVYGTLEMREECSRALAREIALLIRASWLIMYARRPSQSPVYPISRRTVAGSPQRHPPRLHRGAPCTASLYCWY